MILITTSLPSTITLTADLFNSRINQSRAIAPSRSQINPSWPFLITCPLCQKPRGPLTEGECLMSRAPPASLVSATIMRQYHTGAVTPRWVGRSVGVRRGPIMRDKLSQTSASWRWADGVWRRPRRGGFPTRAGGGKGGGEGGGRRGKKTPATKCGGKKAQAEMKKGNGSLQKINKDRWTTGSPHTEAGSVFRFIFLFCGADLVT